MAVEVEASDPGLRPMRPQATENGGLETPYTRLDIEPARDFRRLDPNCGSFRQGGQTTTG